MLAIQRFVNNRECTVLQSGDSSAFYRYINQRRACKDGIAPLLNVNGELAVTDHDKADILNAQFTSVFTVDDGILPLVETRTQSRLADINLSPELIRKFMCKLPNKFSHCPDGIPSAILRSLDLYHSNCVSRSITFSDSRSTLAHAPHSGNQPTLLLYTKKVMPHWPQITVPLASPQLFVVCLNVFSPIA